MNGVRLWYEVAGNSEAGEAPLVYLHGGPGYNSYSFEKTIGSQLQGHLKVVYLDERGSGRSERPWTKQYELSAFVEDIEALRQSLGVPQISVMGHSFGGTIALEYAARFPMHVQKLIIVDGAADMPTIFNLWRREIEQRYPEEWKVAMTTAAGRSLAAPANRVNECAQAKDEFAVEMAALSKVNAQAFHDWQQFHDQRFKREQEALDAESGLHNTGEIGEVYFGQETTFPCYRFDQDAKLTMPTLVIAGKYDGAVGAGQMRALAQHLPKARFDEFEHSGHFPYAEEPIKFAHDVVAFLAGG